MASNQLRRTTPGSCNGLLWIHCKIKCDRKQLRRKLKKQLHDLIWLQKMQRSSIQIILLLLRLQIFSATTAINTRTRKTNKVNLRKKYEVEKMASHSYSSTSGFSKIKIRFFWTLQSTCAVALAAISSQYHIYQNTCKLMLLCWQMWNSALIFNAVASCKKYLNYRSLISKYYFLP